MLLLVDAGADTSLAGGTAELVKCTVNQRELVRRAVTGTVRTLNVSQQKHAFRK